MRRTARAACPSVIAKPNFWSMMPVVTAAWPWMSMPGVTADQDVLRPVQLAGQQGDLGAAVDDDAPDARVGGRAQFGGGLGVAVHDDASRVHATGKADGQFARRAHVEAEALLGQPAGDLLGQHGLARVDDPHPAQRGAVAADAVAEVGLVEHVGRGAELVGDVAEAMSADAQPALVVHPRRERPDVRVDAHRGGVV